MNTKLSTVRIHRFVSDPILSPESDLLGNSGPYPAVNGQSCSNESNNNHSFEKLEMKICKSLFSNPKYYNGELFCSFMPTSIRSGPRGI